MRKYWLYVLFIAGVVLGFGLMESAVVYTPWFDYLIVKPIERVFAPQARILFAGDIMLDRAIRKAAGKRGGDYIFSCIDTLLAQQDLVVANLEGPITGHESVSVDSTPGDGPNFVFTFPPSSAALLFAHHIRMVNLGNNHIRNWSDTGVRSTIAALTDAGVGYFGDPVSATVAHVRRNGIRIALINFNQFEGSPFAGESEASTTLRQIRLAHIAGELPVVYTHWGEEYQPATVLEKRLAHAFIDAGGEAVIGSHPHVVQEHEVYQGKQIYYSLGNFIFDQYWNDAVRNGLAVQVTIVPSGVGLVKEIPVQLQHDGRTCISW